MCPGSVSKESTNLYLIKATHLPHLQRGEGGFRVDKRLVSAEGGREGVGFHNILWESGGGEDGRSGV